MVKGERRERGWKTDNWSKAAVVAKLLALESRDSDRERERGW